MSPLKRCFDVDVTDLGSLPQGQAFLHALMVGLPFVFVAQPRKRRTGGRPEGFSTPLTAVTLDILFPTHDE